MQEADLRHHDQAHTSKHVWRHQAARSDCPHSSDLNASKDVSVDLALLQAPLSWELDSTLTGLSRMCHGACQDKNKNSRTVYRILKPETPASKHIGSNATSLFFYRWLAGAAQPWMICKKRCPPGRQRTTRLLRPVVLPSGGCTPTSCTARTATLWRASCSAKNRLPGLREHRLLKSSAALIRGSKRCCIIVVHAA